MINPFQITKPVDPADVIDREEEDVQLRALAEEGNNVRLIAPRRYGKTSLLRRAQGRLAEEWTTVYVDLLGILTLDDFAARIERAYTEELKGSVAKWFLALRRTLQPTLTLGGGPFPASGSVDLSSSVKQALVERLDLPAKVYEKTGTRVHIVFDEFQELDAVEGNADAIVRSVIQHHGNAASYVFAGSELHMMEMMFNDRRRAFYGQTQRISLNPLDPISLADFVSTRFVQTGKEIMPTALDALLGLVDGHPQRAMLAAHTLWDITDEQADLEEWETCRGAVLDAVDDEVSALWLDLSATERQVLSSVAGDKSPYQRGGQGPRGGAVTNALETLANRGVLLRVKESWVVVDPLLRAWVHFQRTLS